MNPCHPTARVFVAPNPDTFNGILSGLTLALEVIAVTSPGPVSKKKRNLLTFYSLFGILLTMKDIISYETARATGILTADNKVSYSIGIDGRKNSCRATFQFLGSPEETLAAHCCYLAQQPVFTPEGIVTRIEYDGCIAEVVMPEGVSVGTSLITGKNVVLHDPKGLIRPGWQDSIAQRQAKTGGFGA